MMNQASTTPIPPNSTIVAKTSVEIENSATSTEAIPATYQRRVDRPCAYRNTRYAASGTGKTR